MYPNGLDFKLSLFWPLCDFQYDNLITILSNYLKNLINVAGVPNKKKIDYSMLVPEESLAVLSKECEFVVNLISKHFFNFYMIRNLLHM